ncbi:helix-turn-helix domain-containing protein [Lactococcus lactis]|uniref:helix-turn-helix domain-containing protein n=1 Tax=Lactococcus lactis TaxID=1358 RepID=UPI00111DB60F|nr:helix-turn-helix domain-containing protein [Lactococcus lactis]MCC4120190.1 helix-turn-helix domain-containing protein [Lactococcus lactis]MCT0449256.1 helix-turn-helix domain-containing protein [Lactococcus lactis subsp. lactis]TNU79793.1 helix-turn-helix domain-containing protein [Lactococcus lactis subsp. lactis]WDA69636.1 helix-turn-helix domain-containing protein [Lactococcus lactis]
MKKNNSNENYFAINLKYLRQKNNMEQLELANLLGRKSSSSVSEWEKGKYTPKAGVLNDIAKIFSIPLSKLMNENLSEQSITILDKINQVSSELDEPRQKIVLDTASSQLKEQKKENAKVVSIKNEQQKQGIDLADLVDDSKIDWDKWVSFDGKPLTDEVKEAMKKALGKQLEDK